MDDKTYEKVLFDRGYLVGGKKYLAGVDEVGRGPLAGPLVCCAVIMPLDDESIISGVDDSKKLSQKKRELLAEEIKKRAIAYKICSVENGEIDEINILNATLNCMKECVETLDPLPDAVLTDAMTLRTELEQFAVVKGDRLSYTIGAASIVAKVYRDELMDEYDKIYPEYGFKTNKGYGTKAHVEALKEVGYCPIHRKTFIKNFSVEKERTPSANT